AALLVAAATLAACGGNASTGVIPKSDPAAKTKLVSATFSMHWPSAQAQMSTRRSPKFISPSTKSVVIKVNDDSTLTTISNAPSTSGGTTTINVLAPVGSDTFVVSLYDQPQTAGETSPVGKALGQVEVAQTIVAGNANAINATVDGIVSSIS